MKKDEKKALNEDAQNTDYMITNSFEEQNGIKKQSKDAHEPIWCNPFTMAVLTWINTFTGILGILLASK